MLCCLQVKLRPLQKSHFKHLYDTGSGVVRHGSLKVKRQGETCSPLNCATECHLPPPTPPEPPDGEPQSTPAETGEPTVSLSKKPKEEVSVSVRGYHGDGNLATAHLVQPILEEDRPRVVANRKNIKRVTIGRDRRKGASHRTPANWSCTGFPCT